MHLAQALHLLHQVDLRQAGIPAFDPVETLRRSQLLRVEVREEGLEVVVDRLRVVAREDPNGERPACIDGSEQKPLDLVVDRLVEPRRIEVLLHETSLRG